MRSLLALLFGVVMAVVLALIVGEYPFAGLTPYLVAVVVPAIIATVVVATGRRHSDRLWAASGLLGGASIGWALWISTGRGLDPVPTSGWIAIALAGAWPLAWAAVLARRSRRPGAPLVESGSRPSGGPTLS
ncbi:MAG: hypothetical protein M3Y91_05830 [Actinomycetota bacterium]|nr:hypothetical protein [Actinomycetota bacterium]